MELITICILIVVAALAYDSLRFLGTPGPFKFPLVGNLPQALMNATRLHDYYYEQLCALRPQKTFLLRLANMNLWVTTDKANVEHILKTKWENYTIDNGVRGLATEEVFGNGIFRTHGEMWQEQRKTASREFSANRFRFFMGTVFVEDTEKLRKIIADNIASKRAMDLCDLFFSFTMDSFGKIAFDKRLGCLDGTPLPFSKAYDDVQEYVVTRMFGSHPAIWTALRALNLFGEAKLRKDMSVCDEFVKGLITDRRSKSKAELTAKEDLLSRLVELSALDAANEQYDEKYLRDMVMNFIVAGRDTTACGLSWLFYELALNPSVEKRLVEEIKSQLGDAIPNGDNVKDSHYLQACMSETQRLHPSVPQDPKAAVQDDVLPSGHRVKAGESVVYVNYAMGRDPEYWGPDPLVFRPERWLDKDGVYQRADPFVFPAFQAGPRMCLGIDMAHLEMKVVAVMLLQKFTFKLVPGKKVHYRITFVLPVLNGLWMTAEHRK